MPAVYLPTGARSIPPSASRLRRPNFEYYCKKDPGYREEVLPSAVTARVSVEQASTFGWSQYVGLSGHAIGMKTFGASAPLKELQKKFGFTADAVVAAAKEQVGKKR